MPRFIYDLRLRKYRRILRRSQALIRVFRSISSYQRRGRNQHCIYETRLRLAWTAMHLLDVCTTTWHLNLPPILSLTAQQRTYEPW